MSGFQGHKSTPKGSPRASRQGPRGLENLQKSKFWTQKKRLGHSHLCKTHTRIVKPALPMDSPQRQLVEYSTNCRFGVQIFFLQPPPPSIVPPSQPFGRTVLAENE